MFEAFLRSRRKTVWEISRAASSFAVMRRATERTRGRYRSMSVARAPPEGWRWCCFRSWWSLDDTMSGAGFVERSISRVKTEQVF